MQGTQIQHWFESNQHAYIIASIKTKVDSFQYPCITKYDAEGDVIEFTTCIDTPLAGNYNKASNLNYGIASFSNLVDTTPVVFAIRSQTYSGVVLIKMNENNGTFTSASLFKDSNVNGNPIDGQILFQSVTGDKSKSPYLCFI